MSYLKKKNNDIWEFNYEGTNSFLNSITIFFLIFGGLAFYSVGLSIFFKKALFFFIELRELKFFPQGIVMMFYGSFFFFLGIFQILTLIFQLGKGSLVFDTIKNQIILIRKSYPGKNNQIFFSYQFNQVKSIKIVYSSTLPKSQIVFLSLKDGREIPILKLLDPVLFDELQKNILEVSKNVDLITEIIYKDQSF